MSRKLVAASVILSVVVLIVAVVRGQDEPQTTSRDGYISGSNNDSNRQERSVLKRAQRRSATGSGLADSSSRNGRTGGLADRLQRLRQSVSGARTPNSGAGTTSQSTTGLPSRIDSGNPIRIGTTSPRLVDEGASTDRSANGEPSIVERPPARLIEDVVGSSRRVNRDSTSSSSPSLSSEPPTARQHPPVGTPGSLLSSIGPGLQVSTVGPSAVILGKAAEFIINLDNQGHVPAESVHVRIVIPSWVELEAADASTGTTESRDPRGGTKQLIWNANGVAAGSHEQLTLKITPQESRPFDLTVDWTLRPASSIARIEVQQPQLELALIGPDDILYNASSVYTLQLSNPGTGPAEDVFLEFSYGDQQLPAKQIGSLAPGEQSAISVELTARQAGILRVAAIATAAGNLRAEAIEEVRVRRAQIQVDMQGPPMKFAGSVGSYQIHVRNKGDAKATDVVASILLPSGTEYVAGDMKVTNSGGLLARIDELAPGAERVFRLSAQLTAPGDNRIEVRAQAAGDLAASGAFSTHVKALADLKLIVNDPSGPAPVGKDVSYEVTVVNRGTKAASQVTVKVQFSEGIEPIKAAGAKAEVVPGQILFQPIPRVGAGEKVTLTIKARAEREGNHRFRAEVTCAQPETILVAEESTYFFADSTTKTRVGEE